MFPIGAGIWLRLHPEDRLKSPYTSWQFDETTTRMPEFTAPGLGRESNRVVIDAEFGTDASGVLYSLGGAAGGLTLFMDKGELVYEYNMMIIEQYQARTKGKLAARTTVKRTVPAAFSGSETFNVGIDLGSPVSLDYFDRRPFRFDGRIESVRVELSHPDQTSSRERELVGSSKE